MRGEAESARLSATESSRMAVRGVQDPGAGPGGCHETGRSRVGTRAPRASAYNGGTRWGDVRPGPPLAATAEARLA